MRWLSYWTLPSSGAPQKGYSPPWGLICLEVPAFPSADGHSASSFCLWSLVFDFVRLPRPGSSSHLFLWSQKFFLSSEKHGDFMCSFSEYETQPQSPLSWITWEQQVAAVVLKVGSLDPASASAANLSEMWILGPRNRFTESDTLRAGLNNLYYNQPSRGVL